MILTYDSVNNIFTNAFLTVLQRLFLSVQKYMVCITTTFCDKVKDIQVFLARLCSVSCILLCWRCVLEYVLAMLVSVRFVEWLKCCATLSFLLKLENYRIECNTGFLCLMVYWNTFNLGITSFPVPCTTTPGEDWCSILWRCWPWLTDTAWLEYDLIN